MKYLISVILISICSSCVSSHQAVKTYPNPFEYTLKDSLRGSKDYLMNKAHIWMREHISNGYGAINMVDKKSGRITGTFQMTSSSDICMVGCVTQKYSVSFTISFAALEGGYRLSLYDFVTLKDVASLKGPKAPKIISLSRTKHPPHILPEAWTNIKEDCDSTSKKIFLSFRQHMQSPTKKEITKAE